MRRMIISAGFVSIFFLLVSFPTTLNSETPQVSHEPRIVVYETYFSYYFDIIKNDPTAFDEEELAEYGFRFIEDYNYNIFWYLDEDDEVVDVFVEYIPFWSKIEVFSIWTYRDANEITEQEIEENFDGRAAEYRKEAVEEFSEILCMGHKSFASIRTKTPLKLLCMKDMDFKNLDLSESLAQSDSYEAVENDKGELILWFGKYDYYDVYPEFSEMIYLISNHPDKEDTKVGGFEPNNTVFAAYEYYINLAMEQNSDRVAEYYYEKTERISWYRERYYDTLENDTLSTLTILPLLFLRKNLSRELLRMNKFLGDVDFDFDQVKEDAEIFIEGGIDSLNFEGEENRELFKQSLNEMIDIVYKRMNEKKEYRFAYIEKMKKEIKEMETFGSGIYSLIFAYGGILAFFLVTLKLFKIFDKERCDIYWGKTKKAIRYVFYLGLLWIIIHDALRIIYFEYGIAHEEVQWIENIGSFHSFYLALGVFCSALFFWSVIQENKSRILTFLPGFVFFIAYIAIGLYMDKSATFYFHCLLVFLLGSLIGYSLLGKSAKSRKLLSP